MLAGCGLCPSYAQVQRDAPLERGSTTLVTGVLSRVPDAVGDHLRGNEGHHLIIGYAAARRLRAFDSRLI